MGEDRGAVRLNAVSMVLGAKKIEHILVGGRRGELGIIDPATSPMLFWTLFSASRCEVNG
jgi:hypothetical protein